MRYLINKVFKRDLKEQKLDDDYIKDVLDNIYDRRATPLGSKLYKIRAAKKGQGKSGGFRNIFFWKRGELIIFCLLFAKNEQDNLDQDEMKVLKYLSDEYSKLSDKVIDERIKDKGFKEVQYD